MERKICLDCQEPKTLSEFCRHRRTKDGYNYYCKACTRIRSAKYRAANPAKVRAAGVLYRANHREELRIYTIRYHATHPDETAAYKAAQRKTAKGKARERLARAVSRGIIDKPSHCSSCRREVAKRLLHGHHEDYNKPLDVTWLCPQCHGLVRRTG